MKWERGGRAGSGWEPLGVALARGACQSPGGGHQEKSRPLGSQERLKAAGQPHSILCNPFYVQIHQDPSRA